ncbi:MAG: 30S ribosomal protein S2 [Erysipelotrichaceae bacterium]|nr:30S ribosomal protein S2 [Erysipelotrichaceae bacterium]
MSVVSMKKLLEHGSHYGHQTKKWNPKMKPFIYAAKNGVYIINLEKTLVKLDDAYAAMKAIALNNGKILFVGTKKQAQVIVMEEALRSGSFYINQRWLGGLLTNFKTMQKRIKRLHEIEEMEASGTINVYPKKEVANIRKEAARLENFFGGIKEMKQLPNAIFVVDPTEDYNAVAEAKKLNIPVFGFTDTNCDPEAVDFGIPANDDAIRSIKLIVSVMADAIVEAKAGILSYAFQEQDLVKDISMSDVIINVDQVNEENERRRKAKMEERRQREERTTHRPFDRRPRNNDTYQGRSSESRPFTRTEPAKIIESKPVEAAKVVEAPKPVEVAKVVEAPKPVEAVKAVKAVETAAPEAAQEVVAKKPRAKKADVKDGE